MWLLQAINAADEAYFLNNNKICCTEECLTSPLTDFYSQNDLTLFFEDESGVDFEEARYWCDQTWPFGHEMKVGDIVVLSQASSEKIYYGRIVSDYNFDESKGYYAHERNVVWFPIGLHRVALRADIARFINNSRMITFVNDDAFLMQAVIDAYKFALHTSIAAKLVFTGDNHDDIFNLTINRGVNAVDTNAIAKAISNEEQSVADNSKVDNGLSAMDKLKATSAVNFEEQQSTQGAAASVATSMLANEKKALDFDSLARAILKKIESKQLSVAYLVESVLRAKGFATDMRPESTERSATLIASPKAAKAKVKVSFQIKESMVPLSESVLDMVEDVMHLYGAQRAVLVSSSGFTESMEKFVANDAVASKLKLWSNDDLVNELLNNYDKLDSDLRASLQKP